MNALTITLHLDQYDRVGLKTIAAFDGKTEDSLAHEIISNIISSRMETMSWEWGMMIGQRPSKTEEKPKPVATTDLAEFETLPS